MSPIKSTERTSRIRISIVSRSKHVHKTKSLDYSSKLNNAKVQRVHSLSTINIPEHIHTNMNTQKSAKQSFKKNKVETLQSQKLENSKSETRRKSKVSKISRQQSQSQKSSTISSMTTINIKSIEKDSSNENTRNKNITFNDLDHIFNGSTNKILSASSNIQDSKSITNLNNEVRSKSTDSYQSHRSKKLHDIKKIKQKRRKHRYFGYTCCPCSPVCLALSIFCTLLLLAALSAILILLIPMNNKTTIMTTITTSENEDSTTTTSTTTTVSTTTTSTTTSVTSTSTTSTTTTAFYCGVSCLNQSWIDNSAGLALWPFDGSYNDVTGNYNGFSSSNLPSFVTGYIGQAVSFNVSSKQAMFTPYIPLNNVSFTVSVWIQPTGYPNPSDFSIVGLCPTQTTDYCLHINIRNKKLYFGFYYNDCSGNTIIALNQWIHAGFVFDSKTKIQTIYLNGIQDGQASVTSVLRVASGNFTIGTNQGVVIPNNYFQGYIDELSINQRAKSSCEILEIATLSARFKFDSTSPYSDSGPNPVATNSSSTSIISGYINQAISFSGSSTSYFQAWGFTSFGINNQSFSITFWIKPEILSGTLVHLSTSSSSTGSTCFPLLGFASNGSIVAQVLKSNVTIVTATGPILPVSSSWIPIVQTWSSTNGLKLYVNNTLISSMTISTFMTSGITPNYLTLGNCLSGCGGCSNGSVDSPGPFKGAIDDWRIYTRELTSTDVCALFYATS